MSLYLKHVCVISHFFQYGTHMIYDVSGHENAISVQTLADW